MGRMSLEELLPEIFRPDESVPIGRWHPPPAQVTLVGFQRQGRGPIVFEDEVAVPVRLVQRTWRYNREDETKVLSSMRWRLELIADGDADVPFRPGHTLVVAQDPYASCWAQCAKFKKYSKKGDRLAGELPKSTDQDVDPVDWLERNIDIDPWEQDKRYVAGIAFPNGFWTSEQRNKAGDFFFGACPDHEAIFNELFESRDIQSMLKMTANGTISFAYRGNAPALYPEVIDDRFTLMGISIQQSLAGAEPLSKWIGRPVAEFVSERYRDHLNNANRIVAARKQKEGSTDKDIEPRPKPAAGCDPPARRGNLG